MAAASAASAAIPHATPIPAFAPTLSPESLVGPAPWMMFELSLASVFGVLVVAKDVGAVTAKTGTLEVCASDALVLVLVSEIVEIGRLVITLLGGSKKMSETRLQLQTS